MENQDLKLRRGSSIQIIRDVIKIQKRTFDTKQLPEDVQRVFGQLKKEFGEEYALLFIFTMRTCVELHRAWHMTLLTSKILQSIKDKFQLRMTWSLGVVKLIFRVEDGGFEIHRKVPYDYDSEFQDIYMKIAEALVAGHINVHEALLFQVEAMEGKHTAKSGLFLRDFPGRLVLYPLEAATCAVIFFGGDWMDGGIAALTGLAAGLFEYALGFAGDEAKLLLDIGVGISSGVIAGLFYRYDGQHQCLSAILLGTLYWFFYGTAFVLGLLEIIAGELQTGVTRFIAVSIKTFVLCLGSGFGLMITLENTGAVWVAQGENCNTIDLGEKWWRIPLYLLCSASALGQYRLPIVNYWRGLWVQFVAYEVQYQFTAVAKERHATDNLDVAASNVLGAAAAVLAACGLGAVIDTLRRHYFYKRLLESEKGKESMTSRCLYNFMAAGVRLTNSMGIGRRSDVVKLRIEEKFQTQCVELHDPDDPRTQLELDPEEEQVFIEAMVSSEKLNIWAILMPAIYQLVPGSMIAKLWFNSIFPPPLLEKEVVITGTNSTYKSYEMDSAHSDVFSNLMVISTSLALGLIVGFAIVRVVARIFFWFSCCQRSHATIDKYSGMTATPHEDPERLHRGASFQIDSEKNEKEVESI